VLRRIPPKKLKIPRAKPVELHREARRLARPFLLLASPPSRWRAVEPHGQARGTFQYAGGTES
jgi:hypothetical protein